MVSLEAVNLVYIAYWHCGKAHGFKVLHAGFAYDLWIQNFTGRLKGKQLFLKCLVFPEVYDNSSYAHDREDESNGEYKAPKELYEPVRRGIEMGQTMYAGESRPPD